MGFRMVAKLVRRVFDVLTKLSEARGKDAVKLYLHSNVKAKDLTQLVIINVDRVLSQSKQSGLGVKYQQISSARSCRKIKVPIIAECRHRGPYYLFFNFTRSLDL